MTDTNNGWPGKPGVPMNPERDGWHWLKTGHGVAPWLWRDDPQSLTWGMGWETNEEVFAPGDIARVPGTTYLGPCLTPDEATALQARVAELGAALDFYACVDHYQTHNAAAPNVVQFDRGAKARAALEGKKA